MPAPRSGWNISLVVAGKSALYIRLKCVGTPAPYKQVQLLQYKKKNNLGDSEPLVTSCGVSAIYKSYIDIRKI